MAILSSVIVTRQAASPQAVENAVARQVLYGGDLVTNLLELGAAAEADLCAVLADVHELPPLAAGELPRPDASTVRLLPVELASRYGMVCIKERDGTLTVAVSEPLDAQTLFQLEDVLGLTLTQRVALDVRVKQALWRDYGLPLDQRTARLLAKLDGLEDPNPSLAPEAGVPVRVSPGSTWPSGPTSPGLGDSGLGLSAPSGRGSEAARMRPGAEARVSLRPSFRAPSQRPRARHIGPYTILSARLDVRIATTRDEVVDAFFDFVAQYFEYTALFVVHGDLAEGRDAYGPGTDRSRISTIGVPLELPSALATARNAGTWQVLHLGVKTLDEALARDLGRFPEGLVFVMPITLRGRCVMLIYGDRGESDVEVSQLADVIGFGAEVSTALERILVIRKRGGLLSIAPPSGSEPAAGFERAWGDPRRADARLNAMAASALTEARGRAPDPSLAAERAPLPSGQPSTPPAPQPSETRALPETKADDIPTAPRASPVPLAEAPGARPSAPVLIETAPARRPVATEPGLPADTADLPTASEDDAAGVCSADDRPSAIDAAWSGLAEKLAQAGDNGRLSPEPVPVAEAQGDPGAVAPESATLSGSPVPASDSPPVEPTDQPSDDPPSLVSDQGDARASDAEDRPDPVVVSTALGSEPPGGTRRRQRRATLRHSALAEALRPARTISIGPPGGAEELDAPAPSREQPPADLARPVVTVTGRPMLGTPAPGIAQTNGDSSEGDTDEPTEAIPLTRRTFSRRSLRAQSLAGQPTSTSSLAPHSGDDPERSAGAATSGLGGPAPSDKTASHAISYSPRPPVVARVVPEVRLPSVIVDVGDDCQALVDRVIAGDREAAELLVVIGEPAISVVAGRLPGPVPPGSQAQLGDTRASDCGLLLEVLVRLGRAAVPFVAVRAADADSVVRTWATRLLGELPSPEAVRSVVPRLSDRNPEVRQAALAATRMLLAHLDTHDRLVAELSQLVAPASSKVHRLAGIRALRELRHAAAVPALLTLLDAQDKELAQAAESALVETTRQDFGADKARWTQWWNKNRTRHRIEWVIDALMHESPEMRREAGDELKSLTKEYFGYYGDLPAGDRSRVQQQYREWWETRGRAKF